MQSGRIKDTTIVLKAASAVRDRRIQPVIIRAKAPSRYQPANVLAEFKPQLG
jgi:hypothetical protein